MDFPMIDTHQPALLDLPVRRDLIKQRFDQITGELTPWEIQEMVDWLDTWVLGKCFR